MKINKLFFVLSLLTIITPAFARDINFEVKKASALLLQEQSKVGGKPLPKSKTAQPLNQFIGQLKNKKILKVSDLHDFKLSQLSNKFVHVHDDGRVQVVLKVSSITEEQIKTLKDSGFTVERISPKRNRVQGWVSFDKLDEIKALDFVHFINTPSYAIPRKEGSVTTEGDEILKTDTVRSKLKYTGAGIRIGVISDGVDGIFDSVATKDIPSGSDKSCSPTTSETSGVHCKSFSVDGIANGPEGTAMLEIIHDMAPDAELYFANVDTSDDMIDAVKYLSDPTSKKGAGCDIIVDDLGFPNQPFFEDGDLAQVVEKIAQSGVLYVSSAGNDAEHHIQEKFTDVTNTAGENTADGFNDFRDGAQAIFLIIPEGAVFSTYLQWDDAYDQPTNNLNLAVIPFYPSGATAPDGTVYPDGTQYDVGSEAVLLSKDDNTATGGTASELVWFENKSGYDLLAIMYVIKVSGDGDDINFELLFSGVSEQYSISDEADYTTESDAIYGQSAGKDVISVAAIDQADPENIEYFSSQGPVTIDGALRNKPDISAIDGVTVTGNGGFANPFFGTSAASPHVAACLALMMDANSDLSSDEIKTALFKNAVDLGDAGYDTIFGYGRADCYAAVSAVVPEEKEKPTDDTKKPTIDKDPISEDLTSDNNGGGGCSLVTSSSNFQTGMNEAVLVLASLISILVIRRYQHTTHF